jgi:hypothetical protein
MIRTADGSIGGLLAQTGKDAVTPDGVGVIQGDLSPWVFCRFPSILTLSLDGRETQFPSRRVSIESVEVIQGDFHLFVFRSFCLNLDGRGRCVWNAVAMKVHGH